MIATLLDPPIHAEPSEERKGHLQKIVDHVALQRTCNESSNLIFICTHNSRRSHLAAVWASVAAHHFRITDVQNWSGGTESTAFHPNALASLKRSGFRIEAEQGSNPKYAVSFSEEMAPLICFSKRYDHESIPSEDIAAIMVCDDADQNCPHVPGALARIPLPYSDPKKSDGSPEESTTYDQRSAEIAAEMFWVFRHLQHAEE